jgi:hypothetical protein
MLYEIIEPIKDYIIATSFKEAAKEYIKKHELEIKNTDYIKITDHFTIESFNVEYSARKNNFTITRIEVISKPLPETHHNIPLNYMFDFGVTSNYKAPTNNTIPSTPVNLPPLKLTPVNPLNTLDFPASKQPAEQQANEQLVEQQANEQPVEQPVESLESTEKLLQYLITYYDIIEMLQAINNILRLKEDYWNNNIKPKLHNFYNDTSRNHIISKKYDNIYVTSDIHADFQKFVQILVTSGLIECRISSYDNPYDPEIITESEWIKPNTLFIIIGDLIDGKRIFRSPSGNREEDIENEVNDKFGNYELLLHLFIYNLRIKARQINSDILFTIGNHDYFTIIEPILSDKPLVEQFGYTALYDYIHNSAKLFYNTTGEENRYEDIYKTRANTLIEFYKLSPYIYIKEANDKIIFIHGGIHYYNNDITNEIKPINEENINFIQNKFNNIHEELISPTNERIYNMTDYDNRLIEHILTNRIYAEDGLDKSGINIDRRKYMCSTIKNSGYNLIIVGHCPTNEYKGPYERTSDYEDCEENSAVLDENKKGCVYKDCLDDNNIPRLMFVDTASSLAFRMPYDNNNNIDLKNLNKLRGIEILKLSHFSSRSTKNHYNILIRKPLFSNLSTTDKKNSEIQIYPLGLTPAE